jgi:hypothetical protein
MLFVILVLLSSCTRIYNERDRSTTTTTPTSPTPPVTRTTIEFRVVGNASSARIRYSTPVDGLTQVISSLPYSSSFSTAATSLFLSLEVTPLSYPLLSGNPFLAIQIVVNGALFREATANDLSLTTLSVSGTWRQ